MAAPDRIGGRQYQQRQDHTRPQATNHRCRRTRRYVRSHARLPEQGQQPEHRCRHRHDQRSDTRRSAFHHGRVDVLRLRNASFAHVAHERLIEIHDHHDAGFCRHTCHRDQADPYCGGQVVIHERQQPHAARDRKRQTAQHQKCLRPSTHRQKQQHNHQHKRQRNDVPKSRFHRRQKLVLAGPLDPVACRHSDSGCHQCLGISHPAAKIAHILIDVSEDVPD